MKDPEPGIEVDEVIIPATELARRPSRPPDHAAEARALAALSEAMATSPETALHRLVEAVLELTASDSAGVSILEKQDGTPILRSRAIAGAFAANLGGTMPPVASPCGTAMARNQVLLFNEAERSFPDLREAKPRIYENLLAPFQVGGRPAGTIWAIKHRPEGRFESEDARLLARLAYVASVAYQMTTALAEAKQGREELERRVEARTRELTRTTERLAANEERFRRAMGIGTVGVLFFNLNGRMTDANAAFERMSSYSCDELIACEHWETLTPPEFREATARAAAELAERGETEPYEKQMIRKDGSRWWGLFAPTRLSGSGPDAECIEFIIDVTERKRIEAALRESEERLRLALSAGEMGTWQYRIATDEDILDPSMARLLGLSPREHAISLEAFLRAIHDEDRDHVRAEFERSLHDGCEIELEFRVVWPDGSVRWLKDRGRAILGPEDRPLFLTGAAMDITERKRAEVALRESEARLRLAQEVTGIGTWEWDPETGETLWLPEKSALFGLDPARNGQMTYRRVLDEVVHPDDHAKFDAALREALATGEPYECVYRAHRRRPDGGWETCWIITRGRRIPRADGSLGRMLGVTVDITERQATEARLQELQAELLHVSRLSAAGEMVAALAHELNQPLTAISSALEAARLMLAASAPQDREATKEVQEAMDLAAVQALRGGQIIRRLRDFVSRGEADQRLQDTGKLIEEAGTLALVGTRENGIQASFRLAPQLPPVLVDRIQIQQVLLNLIRNAVEAMTQEGAAAGEAPRRELVVTAVSTSPDEVEVSVADTGPGLSPEIAGRLFEPFVTTKPGGMGVGLSISRTIIEAHGGRLWAEPNPGGGTVFRFALPTASSEGVV